MIYLILQTEFWFFNWVAESAGIFVLITGFIALTWLGFERKRRGSFLKRKTEEEKKLDITTFLRVLSYLGLIVGILDIWAGAAGLIIFTLQHNFEDSYASDTEHWNYYQAALTGTSFFTFPKIINWFGADIAYHHN